MQIEAQRVDQTGFVVCRCSLVLSMFELRPAARLRRLLRCVAVLHTFCHGFISVVGRDDEFSSGICDYLITDFSIRY